MSAIDTIRAALFGSPPQNNYKPSREGVLAAFVEMGGDISDVRDQVSGIAAGVSSYQTESDLPTTPVPDNGTTARVYDDPDPENNTFWIVRDGAWEIDEGFVNVLVGAIQPLVDEATQAAEDNAQALGPLRLPNQHPQPSYADGVVPTTRVGVGGLVPITATSLVALGAVNGLWNATGTTSNATYDKKPLPAGAVGRYIYMSVYTVSPVLLGLGTSGPLLLDATNQLVTSGLTLGYELVETGAGYYVERHFASGVVAPNATHMALGRPMGARSADRLVTGVYYCLSDKPLSSTNCAYDDFRPSSAVIGASQSDRWQNRIAFGDFVGGAPVVRSGSPVVSIERADLKQRGLDRAIQWRAGNEFIRYSAGASLLGKYFFGAFIVNSADAANLLPYATVFEEGSGGATTEAADVVRSYLPLSADTRLVWASGYIDTDVSQLLIGSGTAPAVAGTRYASEFTLFIGDAPIDGDEALRQIAAAAKARAEARTWARAVANDVEADSQRVTLTGVNGLVTIATTIDGKTVERVVDPFPDGSTAMKTVFNFVSDTLDGTLMRTMNDDVAPVRLVGPGTVGGNHGGVVNRSVSMFADARLRTERTGTLTYRDSLAFLESYEIDVGAGTIAAVTNGYVFDRDGQCTIACDFTALANITLQDLMFLQAIRGNADRYYIPNVIATTHQGFSRDYAMIDTSSTAGWATGLNFTPALCEPGAPRPDRIVMLDSAGRGFVVGYLPILSAAPDVRPDNTTVKAMEVRETGKFYPSAIDKGAIALSAGETFSIIGYRNLIVPESGRTAFYPVRTAGKDYLFADWHDRAGMDVLTIPPDFIGRPFTIAQGRNVARVSQTLTGSLRVQIDADDDYAYLALEVV